jgi:predicted metal-dependent phosphoesterase TrpH
MVEKLKEFGIDVELPGTLDDSVHHSFGRPHLATQMKKNGYVATLFEAFERYIGEGRPAFVPKWAPTPVELIELIHGAAVCCLVFRTNLSGLGDLFTNFSSRLDGVEAFILHILRS